MGLFRKSRKKAVRKNFRKRAKAADSVRTSEEKAAAGQVTGPEEGSEPEEKTLEKAGEIAAKADPSRVFYYFRQISAIPRGSHHTEAISDYLADFAAERGLEYVQDEANNVIIAKKASKGCEERRGD